MKRLFAVGAALRISPEKIAKKFPAISCFIFYLTAARSINIIISMSATALIPLDYQGFKTTEAIFDPAWLHDPLKRFRMTRKGWGEFFGAKNPQQYMNKLKHKCPYLPDGIPVTVTVTEDYNWKEHCDSAVEPQCSPHSTVTVTAQCPSKRTREITVLTLDIFEGHAYAVESTLPKAKQFLRRFPDFMKAIIPVI